MKSKNSYPLLNSDMLCHHLADDAGAFVLEIVPEVDSSNTALLQRIPHVAHGTVLAAELQTAGRGQHGRVWHAAPGDALTFSLLWQFDLTHVQLAGLSLAVGVAIVRALNIFNIPTQLKWPNDIVTPLGKLAGVLIETRGKQPIHTVIGIGLNYQNAPQNLDQTTCALAQLCHALPERNQLFAVLLRQLKITLAQFDKLGFAGLQQEWMQYHRDQQQMVLVKQKAIQGIALGVNSQGALLLQTPMGLVEVYSGEIGSLS